MTRWTPQQKRKLIWRYMEREIDLEYVESLGVSTAEFHSWLTRFDAHGLAGLSVTKHARFTLATKRAYIEMVYGGLYGLRLRRANEAECDRLVRAIQDFRRAEGRKDDNA